MINKALRTVLFVLCMIGALVFADGTSDNVEELITANEVRSHLQMHSCSQMLQLHGDRYTCGFLSVPEN